MNEEYLIKLFNVPRQSPEDVLWAIYYLDHVGEKALAEYLNHLRADMLLYDYQNDQFDYWKNFNQIKNEIKKYDDFEKMSKQDKEDLVKIAANRMNRKFERKEFAHMELKSKDIKPKDVPVVYSIEDKIKYYKERVKKADKFKLSNGQVDYALSFLRRHGVSV